MRILSLVGAVCVAMGAAASTWAADKPEAKAQASVPVKVVVLYSSGVGYFEHIGPVQGDASTELRFKTNQINDILKSLVLQDTGGGKVSSIVYPSQEPIARLLRSFQVDITANPALAELLNQLRGAKLKVTVGTEALNGTILGLEKRPKAVKEGHIEVWVLNLLSGGTIRSVPLEEISKLELEDAELQAELNKALAAVAQSRDQDKKPVTIQFAGQGERMVRVGYVVETPVWKTSYRLILGAKPEDKSALQGWAIVENQTDNDWSDVQLSLVSGRPISFIQELYTPLYVPRPVVQPELYASLRPQTYDAGMVLERKQLERAAATMPPGAAAPMAKGMGGRPLRGESREMLQLAAKSDAEELADKPMDASASIASVASAAKIGELFQYTVGNVSLPRQRSAMIPIITDPVEVEKLSIYNASVLPKNPLYGARVKNTTGKHLLAGPITVLQDAAYAGDARIDNLPPGQERLISYGIDLQMLLNATKHKQDSSIVSGSIVRGVLHVKRKNLFTQEYVAENKAEQAKTLIVEHPFRSGWKLVETPKPIETTEAVHRFKQAVPAGQQVTLTVKEEQVTGETLAILPMDPGTLEFYSKNGQISPKVREALAKAAALKQAMSQTQQQIQDHRNKLNQITAEQQRIRENIKTVPDKSAYQLRLISKLEEQEKTIDDLLKKQDEAQKTLERQRNELNEYVGSLSVEE